MKSPDLCDVCGLEVPEGEGYREEVSVGSSMCPTPMSFHQECWERASQLWQPDPDSLCAVDPRFPETAKWMQMSAEDPRS